MEAVFINIIKILPFHGILMSYMHFRRALSFIFITRLLICFWSVLMVNIAFLLYRFRSMMMVMELLMMNKAMIPMITAIALKHKGKSPNLL